MFYPFHARCSDGADSDMDSPQAVRLPAKHLTGGRELSLSSVTTAQLNFATIGASSFS